MNKELDRKDIEQQLDDILNPVTPQKEFISSLQERLKSNANIVIEHPNYFISILLIVSGLFIGVVILWLLKIIYSFSKRHD